MIDAIKCFLGVHKLGFLNHKKYSHTGQHISNGYICSNCYKIIDKPPEGKT